MEFFATLPIVSSPQQLKEVITIPMLPSLCASITTVMESARYSGEIYSIWGQFRVNREELQHGVRFTLPACPNALAWTITQERHPQRGDEILIHASINKEEHEADFIESIEGFMDDWQQGLGDLLG